MSSKRNKVAILTLLTTLLFNMNVYATNPRVILWGLSGSETIARADVLFPFLDRSNQFLYANIQGETDKFGDWYSGLGFGYRQIYNNKILGSYLFLDREESHRHNAYYILNPGLEALSIPIRNNFLDFRFNCYFPVSQRQHFLSDASPFISNTGGNNINCDLVVLQGHQEFHPHFSRYEEVGPGIDFEAGIHLPQYNNLSVYAGGYFFNLSNLPYIKGVEGRLVFPVRKKLALTFEASYDTVERGAILAGFALTFGGPDTNRLEDHFYDRVVRNVSSVAKGTSTPVETFKKNEGLFLARDNIFFFTSEGGSPFDGTANSGTFENPLAADELNQATLSMIDQFAPNANFYFNSGAYIIAPASTVAPNASIILLDGQSFFGRSMDYQCSAIGDERPLLLGELILTGNNAIDSIRLANNAAGPSTTIAIDAVGASNILLINDQITASSTIIGDDSAENTALGIRINRTNLTMINSQIDVAATITGSNHNNQAIGMGNISDGSALNNVTLRNSLINVNAHVGNLNLGGSTNQAIGIGVAELLTPTRYEAFELNQFAILGSEINATAEVETNGDANNQAVAIGNGVGRIPINIYANLKFSNNNFSIDSSNLNSTATTSLHNAGLNQTTVIGTMGADVSGIIILNFEQNNFAIQNSNLISHSETDFNTFVNAAVGIGNVTSPAFSSFAYGQFFENNNFFIGGSTVQATATTRINDFFAFNQSLTIGNVIGGAIGTFNDDFSVNIFTINNSNLFSEAHVNELNNSLAANAALNIGNAVGNVNNGTPVKFNFNTFFVSNSNLSAFGMVARNDNTALNFASNLGYVFASDLDINGFQQNFVIIDPSQLTSVSSVKGNNLGINNAFGVNAGMTNTINILESAINVSALVSGNNGMGVIPAENRAIGVFADQGSIVRLIDDVITVKAIVTGTNTSMAVNSARGKDGQATFFDATTTYNVLVQ